MSTNTTCQASRRNKFRFSVKSGLFRPPRNRALDRGWLENLDIVLRIHIVRHGRHNHAVDELRIGFDLRTGNDEATTCGGLPIVADRDFLDFVREPHTFFIVMGQQGLPTVSHYTRACMATDGAGRPRP